METIILHSNTKASSYINKFLVSHHKLSLIPNEEYTEGHVIILFLNNIEDPEYSQTIEFLNNSNTTTLDACISEVRKTEVSQNINKRKQKRLQNTLHIMVESGDIKTKIINPLTNSSCGFSEKIDVTESQVGEFRPTKRGLLALTHIQWEELDQGVKLLIHKYNNEVRTEGDLSKVRPPSNVTVLKNPEVFTIHTKPQVRKNMGK